MSDHCAACPVRALGIPCAAHTRPHPRLCHNAATNPAAFARQIVRLSREDAEAGRGPRPATVASARPAPVPLAPGVPVLDEWDYITTDRLIADTHRLAARLPHSIDLVVAVARSGLLPGSLIATELHLPLMTVSRFGGLVDPGHGGRMAGHERGRHRHVLLIDDTAASGTEMRANLPTVRAAHPDAEITRAVVYGHPNALGAIDLCSAVYPGLHFLSWNWASAGHGAACAFDHDGILCRDFTPEECRDEASYRAAMATIEPLHLPRRRPVPLVVTARPESCRDLTEAWLDRWGVRVDKLVMWDGEPHPPAEQIAPWKARHYAASSCAIFAESDPYQAERINALTGKPVLCPQAGRVFPPRAVELPPLPACRFRKRNPATTCPRSFLCDKGRYGGKVDEAICRLCAEAVA